MSRVFLSERVAKYDLTDAKRYGKFVFILEKHVSPFKSFELRDRVLKSLVENKFNPRYDFFCLTGQAIVVPLVLSVITRVFWKVKILMFDARENRYAEIIFESSHGPSTTVRSDDVTASKVL